MAVFAIILMTLLQVVAVSATIPLIVLPLLHYTGPAMALSCMFSSISSRIYVVYKAHVCDMQTLYPFRRQQTFETPLSNYIMLSQHATWSKLEPGRPGRGIENFEPIIVKFKSIQQQLVVMDSKPFALLNLIPCKRTAPVPFHKSAPAISGALDKNAWPATSVEMLTSENFNFVRACVS